MSLTFSVNERANLTIGLEKFRSMVNYESGKNKGYVRLTRDSKNQLVLDKFNNKLDVSLKVRSNTGAVESQVLRETFLRALKGGMAAASESEFREIERMLLGRNGELTTKPLSRREIRNVFSKYDQLISTPERRKQHVWSAIDRQYNKAVQQLGYQGKKEDFVNKYMRLAGGNTNPRFAKFYEQAEVTKEWLDAEAAKPGLKDEMAHDVQGAKKSVPMKESEMSFITELTFVEQLGESAIGFLKLEKQIKTSIAQAMDPKAVVSTDPKDPFAGSGLSNKLVSDIRNALIPLLELEDVDTNMSMDTNVKGNTVEAKGEVLKMFMDKVVPAMFRQAREQQALMGDKHTEALMTLDTILDTAKEFFAEAQELKEFIEQSNEELETDTKALEGDPNAKQLSKKKSFAEKMKSWLATSEDQIEDTAFLLKLREKIVVNSGLSFKEGNKNGTFASIVKSFSMLKNTEKLEQMTAAFITKHYPAVNQEGALKPTTRKEMADQLIDHALLATKLNYGERWPNGRDRLWQGVKIDKFLEMASNELVKVVNEYGRGDLDRLQEMYSVLSETRLMKVVNSRIQNHEGHTVDQRLHLADDKDLAVLMPGFKAAAKLYNLFSAKATALHSKAYDAFNKILKKEVKSGKLSAEQAESIRDDVLGKTMVALVKQERRIFLSSLNANNITEKEVDEFVKENAKGIDKRIQGALDEAMGIANQRILLMSAAVNKLKFADLDMLKSGSIVSTFVNQAKDKFVDMLRPALERTFNAVAREQLDKVDVKKNLTKEESKAVLDKITNEFNSRATKLVDRVKKLRNEAVTFVKDTATDVVGMRLKEGSDPQLAKYAQLKSNEQKAALVEDLSNEALSRMQDKIDEALEAVIRHPDNFKKKKDITGMLINDILDSFDKDAIGGVMQQVMDERVKMVNSWLGKPEETKTLFTNCMTNAKAQLDPNLFKDLPDLATMRVIAGPAQKVLDRVKDLPILYASNFTKEKFEATVTKEIAEAAKAPLAHFSKEWSAFLKGANKIEAPFLAMGKEDIDWIRRMVATTAAKSKDLANVNVKSLNALYTKLLQENLDNRVTDIQLDFDAFVLKIDSAMKVVDACKTNFRNGFLAKSENLPQAVKDHFTNVIEPKYAEHLYAKVCADPNYFLYDHTQDSLTGEAESRGGFLAEHANKANYSNPESSRAIIKDLRMGTTKTGENTLKLMDNAIATYARGEKSQAQLVPYLTAYMDSEYAMGVERKEYADLPKEWTTLTESVEDDLRSVCEPLLKELRITDLCKTENMEVAMGAFKEWLNGYREVNPLPEGKFEGETLEEHALSLFNQNVKDLQERILKGEKFDAQVINGKFLEELSILFGTLGTKLALQEVLIEKTESNLTDEIAHNPDIFDVDAVRDQANDPMGKFLYDAVSQNRTDLNAHFQNVVMRTSKQVEELNITSYEGFARCKENVETIFANNTKINGHSVFIKCKQRVDTERFLLENHKKNVSAFEEHLKDLQIELADTKRYAKIKSKREDIIDALRAGFSTRLTHLEEQIRTAVSTDNPVLLHDLKEKYEKSAIQTFLVDLEKVKLGVFSKETMLKDYQEICKIQKKAGITFFQNMNNTIGDFLDI